MPLLDRLRNTFKSVWQRYTAPRKAYDHWAAAYDNQPNNLMLHLDEQVTGELIAGLVLTSPVIADIGCGTGRHWNKLQAMKPKRLLGFDVSQGMLDALLEKYPGAETFRVDSIALKAMGNESCDLVISTLVIAHIDHLEEALEEWHRVLKPGGDLLITDFHPDALAAGAKRSFGFEGRQIHIKNFVHPISKIVSIARQLHMEPVRFTERVIDESVKDFYALQEALHLYQQFFGRPIIYGIHLKKSNAHQAGKHTGQAGFARHPDQ